MKLIPKIKAQSKAGFSLVELLTVVAIVGILAAVALPGLINVGSTADKAQSQRNAQNIANIYAAARASGVTTASFGVDVPMADAAAAAAAVMTALSDVNEPVHGQGPFSSVSFKLSKMNPADVTTAAAYLVWNDTHKTLNYDASDGGSPPSGSAN